MDILHNLKTLLSNDPADDSARVRMSSSGALSIDVEDLVKTRRFQDDIAAVRRIAKLSGK